MAKALEQNELLTALKKVGDRLLGYDEIEVLIVGGMAGKLAGLLPAHRTTIDCDVMVYDPEGAFGQVESAAFEVAREMGLDPRWLNGECSTFAYKLPSGWRQRRIRLGQFGLLCVFCVDRFDFIALKVLSGRAIDQQDLLALKVTSQEIAAVRNHVNQLQALGQIQTEVVEEARGLLADLETLT